MGSLVEEFESKYWCNDQLSVGIDEAGRGPMAGPCMVAAVVFPKDFNHDLINDSKKLSHKQREMLVSIIKTNALWFDIITVDEQTIDSLNIYKAVQEAMNTLATTAPANVVLTDAMPLPNMKDKEVISIIKGDARSISIAAASILAKTERDKYMMSLHELYPRYGFDKHKGYGTKAHKEAILKFGRCPHHRTTFKFKDETQISLDI